MKYEADPRHAEIIWQGVGLDAGSKGLDRPSVKETAAEAEDAGLNAPVPPQEASRFRALAARANYLAADRPDIGFAVKELCRDMAAPTRASQAKLKRLGRYLLEYPRLEWDYPDERAENDLEEIRVFTDSDWAGCLRTRRSTSGGMITLAGVSLKHWSRTQGAVALSSWEAEYAALVKAATEGLALQALAKELGWSLKLVIFVDSSAAKAIASRSGVGKVRHLAVKTLWVQEGLKSGALEIRKVSGTANPANALTKSQGVVGLHGDLALVGARPIRRRRKWADTEDEEEGERAEERGEPQDDAEPRHRGEHWGVLCFACLRNDEEVVSVDWVLNVAGEAAGSDEHVLNITYGEVLRRRCRGCNAA